MLALKHLSIFFLSILLGSNIVFCQNEKPATAVKPVVLKLKLGPFDGKTKALLADAKKALKLEVTVTDSATGEKWTLIRFRLGWKQKDFSDNPDTGEHKPIYTYNAVTVRESAKIPEAWQKEMTDNLKAGEQILIEEVLAQDPKNKKLREVRSVIISVI